MAATDDPGDDSQRRGLVRNLVAAARQQAAASVLPTAELPRWGVAAGPPDLPGYDILREIHRGGQGVVYQALQRRTRREVAIKVMKEGPFAGRSERMRFDREVQILGALNHPHIVTIHDTGSTSGSFYFVMDYVSGEPLDAYMAKRSCGIDECLQVFVRVCEAVQAAHLRGVIHRDLKPGNIRVDEGGQPHILDFGLAKVIGGPDSAAVTVAGQFLGSLPWASPEQAAGHFGKLDLRTDVYSLGVILYQLLTGRFPYEVVGSMHAVLEQIMRVEPVRPSTICRHIDDELETIVLKCLSKDPARRYQTAGELARDIRHYLAGDPIEAKRDSGWYVLRKTLRRYRAPAAAAGAVVLALVLGLIATLWQAHRADERAAAASKAETQARAAEAEQFRLAEAEGIARREADERRAEEAQARQRADAVNEFVTRVLVTSDPYQQGRQGFKVADAMDQAIRQLESGEMKDQPQTEAGLRLTIAKILNGNARPEDGLRVALRALEINQGLHAGDHSDVGASMHAVARCLESLGRHAEALPHFEAALEMFQRLFQGDHPSVAASLNNVASCLNSLDRSAEALPKYEASLEMLRRLFQGDHPSVAASLNNVAHCLESLGRSAEALPKYEAALWMRQQLFQGDHPDVAQSLNNVASCLNSLGRSAKALPMHEAALEMYLRLFQNDHPRVANSLNNLAACLRSLSRSAEALPKYEAALEMRERLYQGDHSDVALSLSNVAGCLQALGRPAEALPKYEAALEMRRRLFQGDHSDVAQSLNHVAGCLQALGRPAEALPKYEVALEIRQRLFQGDHPQVATSLNDMAFCLKSLGRSVEALPRFEAALEMFRRLFQDDHAEVASSLNNLASCLKSLGRLAEALPKYEAALEMRERLFQGDHPDVAQSLNNVAGCLKSLERSAEALPKFEAATEMFQRLFQGDHPNVALTLNNMAACLNSLGRPAEALPKHEAALEMSRRVLPPGHPNILHLEIGLAGTLVDLGRFADAEPLLLDAAGQCERSQSNRRAHWRSVLEQSVRLYDAWHASQPDKGYDDKGAAWRAKLAEFEATTQPSSPALDPP